MFCCECGKKLNPGDKFCSGCGTRAPVEESSASYSQVPPKHNAQDVIRPRSVPTPPPKQETVSYCQGCGQEMSPQDQFCMNCGWKAGSAYAPPKATKPAQPVKKKASRMKIWGIVLVVLQVIVAAMSLDELAYMAIPELLGFFMIGIIGVILLIRDHRKNRQ